MERLQPRTVRRAVVASLVAVIATLTFGTSASATVIGHQHFSDSYSFSYNDCGFPSMSTGRHPA